MERAPKSGPRSRRVDGALASAAAALCGYLLLAREVGDLYPFSTFPMYSARQGHAPSRLVLRDGAGELHELGDATAVACEGPREASGALAVGRERCPLLAPFYTIDYLDRDLMNDVSIGTGLEGHGVPTTLVRLVWRLDAGAMRTETCELARCRAVLEE